MLPDWMTGLDEEAFVVDQHVGDHQADEGEKGVLRTHT